MNIKRNNIISKINLSFYARCLGLSLLLVGQSSCRQEVDEFKPSFVNTTHFRGVDLRPDSTLWITEPSDTSSIETSFNELMSSPASVAEEFTMNPGTGGTFTTSNGVRVTIPQNAVAASTNVKVLIRAILRRGDMVRTSMTTMQDSTVFAFGGMVLVNFSQNNRPLNMQPTAFLRIQIPAYNNNPLADMELLRGTERGYRNMNWQPQSDTFNRVSIGTWRDQGTLQLGYELTVNSLGWVGVGYKMPQPVRSTVCVGLDSTYHPQNAAVFMVYRNFNAVVRFKPVWRDRKWCIENVPVGMPATIIVLARRAGNPFFSFSDMIPLPLGNYSLVPLRSNRTQIDGVLNSF